MEPSKSKQTQVFPSLVETSWFVGFTNGGETPRWWQKYLKEGFKHLYMYTKLADKQWLVLTMTQGGLIIYLLNEAEISVNAHEHLANVFKATTISLAKGTIHPYVVLKRRGLFTCVELAKSILGIGNWIQTPWQLARYINVHR